MRKPLTLAIVLMLQVSCSHSKGNKAPLMDAIDAVVVMPESALPLERYARYYAYRPDGKVAVFLTAYTKDDAPKPPDYGCSIMTEEDTLEDVPCPPDDEPRAGERRWVTFDEMPGANDGACFIVNVVYDPSDGRIEEISCNGPA